jgi:tRNA (cmo5U34)-methyltransferase
MNNINLWTSSEHALQYLGKADKIPHRTEGEAVLLAQVPKL